MSKPYDGSRSAAVECDFGDGTYRFRLSIAQLRELDEKTQVGPSIQMDRLLNNQWRIDDVREPIRLGLIGGGMVPSEALTLVRRYVEDMPEWARNAKLAFTILAAAIMGYADESPGKQTAAKTKRTRKGASNSPSSTPPQP